MKRLIFLKVADANPDDKKIKKTDLKVLEEKAQKKSIEAFKAELKRAPVPIKVIKELPEAQAIVEFSDAHSDVAYDFLRKLDIVEIIDAILPPGN